MSFHDMRRAVRHYPRNRYLQVQWLRSVAYLRSRNLWVLEDGPPKFHAAR